LRFAPGGAPQVAGARAALAAGDTALALALAREGTLTHGADAAAHGLLADLLLLQNLADPEGAIEAWATRALAPRNPYAWRRVAMVQIQRQRDPQALASLERYFELAGELGREDLEAQKAMEGLRERMPGGRLAQEELRK
jgi:hypothetical protein